MARDNQRIMLTKRLLKEALLRLLDFKGVEEINITELCAEAGINRATFYRHYSLPHDLLDEIERDYIESFRSRESKHIYNNLEELKDNLTMFCSFTLQNAELVKKLIRNGSADKIVDMFSGFFQNYLHAANSNITNPLDTKAIILVADYLSAGGFYMIRRWLMESIPKTPEEIASLILNITNLSFAFHWKKGN